MESVRPASTIMLVRNSKDNIEILMAYYFQQINIQIFPSERLAALINFWNYAKKNNLEKIAFTKYPRLKLIKFYLETLQKS